MTFTTACIVARWKQHYSREWIERAADVLEAFNGAPGSRADPYHQLARLLRQNVDKNEC